MRKFVEIFTDGACSGNPGPGGWGVVLRFGSHEKELSGGERETTLCLSAMACSPYYDIEIQTYKEA